MSILKKQLTEMKEDCEEMKYMERELATVDQFIPRQNRKFICYIGHDLHGHFDPDHVDFELLCGTIHTEKAAPAFPIIISIFIFFSLVAFIMMKLYYFIPLHLINIPFVISLYFAIKKRSHRGMLPFLFFAAIEKILWLLTIIILCIVVFNPHWSVYLVLQKVCKTSVVDTQMAVLLTVLIFSICLFIMLYLDHNILYHFVYLGHVNTKCCEHTANCPGRGDVDPVWHAKKNNPGDISNKPTV